MREIFSLEMLLLKLRNLVCFVIIKYIANYYKNHYIHKIATHIKKYPLYHNKSTHIEMSPHTKWYTLHTVDKCNHCVCQSTDQDTDQGICFDK